MPFRKKEDRRAAKLGFMSEMKALKEVISMPMIQNHPVTSKDGRCTQAASLVHGIAATILLPTSSHRPMKVRSGRFIGRPFSVETT